MKKKSFEDALEKLEDITRELEEGDLSLEESLKHFDEGVKLAEYCNSKLSDAQKKVEILMKKNDSLEPVPFDEPEEEDE
jgi:exodeoxyribonuclease VII small subunit